MQEAILNGPIFISPLGTGIVTAQVRLPTSSPHLATSLPHGEMAELKTKYFHCQKVSSKHYHLTKCLFYPLAQLQLQRDVFRVVREMLLSQCRCVNYRFPSDFGVNWKTTQRLVSKQQSKTI